MLYVRNVSSDVTDSELFQFVQSLGFGSEVRDVHLLYDSTRNKHKGYGYVHTTLRTGRKLVALGGLVFHRSKILFEFSGMEDKAKEKMRRLGLIETAIYPHL